jgi:uncharacterized damage-inducible protein DinB
MKDHFAMFAAYNRWANGVLYDAARALPVDDLGRNQGAFFGSLIATLNHLLVADRIWMLRFTGAGEAPRALDTILFADFAALETARRAEDERIIAWIDALDDEAFRRTFSYTPVSSPETVTQRLDGALSHLFNHQTHHRGQCHMMLTSLGRPSISLDLVYFQRSQGRQWL